MNTLLRFSTLALSFLVLSCSHMEKRIINPARPGDLSYRKLMLKDYDQMLAAVRKHIREAKKELARSQGAETEAEAETAAFVELRGALRLVFSRPDTDNMVAKLVPEVRRELALYNAYHKVIHQLAREGVQAFEPSLGVNTLTLATYTFMLQNMMGEIQVEAHESEELQQTLQMIADADIRVPKDVIRERKLSGMFLTESPSQQAERILKKIQASQK